MVIYFLSVSKNLGFWKDLWIQYRRDRVCSLEQAFGFFTAMFLSFYILSFTFSLQKKPSKSKRRLPGNQERVYGEQRGIILNIISLSKKYQFVVLEKEKASGEVDFIDRSTKI